MGKRETYGQKAEDLYVRHGKTLQSISGILGVAIQTLSRWKSEGIWEEKRKSFLLSRTGQVEKLKDMMCKLIDETEEPSAQFADKLYKLNLTAEKLEGRRDVLDETVAVMDDFTAYVRGKEKEEKKIDWLLKMATGYFQLIRERR